MSQIDDGLFKAFSKEGLVPRKSLLNAFSESGILDDDVRYSNLIQRLKSSNEFLSPADFHTLQECAPTLFEQVLSGQLAIPHFKEFGEELTAIFD